MNPDQEKAKMVPNIEVPEPKVFDLGESFGRFRSIPGAGNILEIVSPANNWEDSYSPAESVRLYGKHNILKLRDALNEIYP